MFEDRALHLVDVEGLASSGAPRYAFTLLDRRPGHPMRWRLDLDVLRDLGWQVKPGGLQPPPHADATSSFPNHPFALGSAWSGSGTTWHATFDSEAGTIKAAVNHELVEDDDEARIRPVHTSETPWKWRIDGPQARRHGSAASPILAAGAAEAVLRELGCDVAEPTTTHQHLP